MADIPFYYQELFELGPDDTAYRLLTKEHVAVKTLGRAGGPLYRAGRHSHCFLHRRFTTSISFSAPPICSRWRRSSTTPRVGQRSHGRTDHAQECRRGECRSPAVLPGYRDGHHHGQEGTCRLVAGRRRGPGTRRLHRIHRAQPAVLAKRPADDVGGEEHEHESARADRPAGLRRRCLRIPVHRQRRRLGQ